MDDPSRFQAPMPRYPVKESEADDLAEAADIPSPPPRVLEDELSAQARRKDRNDLGTLPNNLMEAVWLRQEMEREGRRVGMNRDALMDFLRDKPGDTISAELLAAMAMVVEAISERRRTKEKSSLKFYLNRGINFMNRLISKVVDSFKN